MRCNQHDKEPIQHYPIPIRIVSRGHQNGIKRDDDYALMFMFQKKTVWGAVIHARIHKSTPVRVATLLKNCSSCNVDNIWENNKATNCHFACTELPTLSLSSNMKKTILLLQRRKIEKFIIIGRPNFNTR